MAAIIAFGISVVLLGSFLGFKVLEQRKNLFWYAGFRTKADVVVLETIERLEGRAQRLEEQLSLKNIFNIVVHRVASVVAHVARTIEGHAEDVTRKMSRNGNGHARTTRSSFLHEVETHKNGLDTERVRRETSLTEREIVE